MNISKEKQKISTVAILAKDTYSRNWISHIILFDWRTRIVGELMSFDELKANSITSKIDFLLIDVDDYKDNLNEILNYLINVLPRIKTLLLASTVEEDNLIHLSNDRISGYLLKSESDITLGWAIAYLMEGKLVITETILKEANSQGFDFGPRCLVINGIDSDDYLTSTENRYARLAFIHSMPRSNLADELLISTNSSFTLISNLYTNLGVTDLLNGDDWINFNIEKQGVISSHFVESNGCGYKPRNGTSKETIAFHVYSKPRIVN
ncbi:response regulator transcription factor [Chloroflexota bacterium]|nr:response regulator transcription factor [Chloroflexota bacterium]